MEAQQYQAIHYEGHHKNHLIAAVTIQCIKHDIGLIIPQTSTISESIKHIPWSKLTWNEGWRDYTCNVVSLFQLRFLIAYAYLFNVVLISRKQTGCQSIRWRHHFTSVLICTVKETYLGCGNTTWMNVLVHDFRYIQTISPKIGLKQNTVL